MDAQYEAFCFTDPRFYDAPGRTCTATDRVFDATTRELPEDWNRTVLGTWIVLRPVGVSLPTQGWKIHVTACLDNAEHVLSHVWEHCTRNGLTFKFLNGPTALLLRNSKYAARDGSGKLVTIYPADEAELERVCDALGARLAGQPGPYILSDLRYGAGPLHVRYGGFAERFCQGPTGESVPAVERPDGTLVPDTRRPVFSLPDWVRLPAFLQPHLDARNDQDVAMPYRVTRALHFSNGGGVYLGQAENEDGTVVLKEARPHAGLDHAGADAVARLAHEADVLALLDGIDGIPRLRERFGVWEHRFLAMEHLPGIPLSQWLARNYPLTRHGAGPAEIAGYTDRAVALLERIGELLQAVHARGIVYGDLHPRNILVDADDRVSLVDFELAAPVAAPVRPPLGAPGFMAPADRTGVAIDHYALAAVRLFLFLPLGAVLALAPEKLEHYLDDIDRRFPLPPGFTAGIRAALGTAPTPGVRTPLPGIRRDWPAARDSLVAGILENATPERTDRLFPGDIAQFRTGGDGLAHGAAGVLHALDAVGAGRFPEHEQWLIDRVTASPPRRPGLYDGAAGVAWLLQRFGHHDAAGALLSRLLDALPRVRDTSLFGGLAGIGGALLDLATLRDDPALERLAVAAGDRVAVCLDAVPPGGNQARARAGLLRGWSGAAALFLQLHERTADDAWLERATAAVERDLADCIRTRDGTLQVDDVGRRTLPYLGVGSAGITVVAAPIAALRPDGPVAAALPELVRACAMEFVIQPGLFAGRAGLIAALTAVRAAGHRYGPGTDPGDDHDRIERHLDRLDWHAVAHDGHLAFPGDQLLRLSTDLATGSAGVLLAAAAALDEHPPPLPGLAAPAAIPLAAP